MIVVMSTHNLAKEWARIDRAQKKTLARFGHTVKSFLDLGKEISKIDQGELHEEINVGQYGKVKFREKTLMIYKTTCPKCGQKLGVKFDKTYKPYLEDKHVATKSNP